MTFNSRDCATSRGLHSNARLPDLNTYTRKVKCYNKPFILLLHLHSFRPSIIIDHLHDDALLFYHVIL